MFFLHLILPVFQVDVLLYIYFLLSSYYDSHRRKKVTFVLISSTSVFPLDGVLLGKLILGAHGAVSLKALVQLDSL